MKPIVIYDSECNYCSYFVEKIKKSNKFEFLSYHHKDAKSILKKRFGKNFGFTLYLIDGNRGFYGKEAARRICNKLGFLGFFSYIAYLFYPLTVKLVSFLTRRKRKVCYPSI